MLFTQGQHWIKNYQGQLDFDFVNEPQIFDKFMAGIVQINIIGAIFVSIMMTGKNGVVEFFTMKKSTTK